MFDASHADVNAAANGSYDGAWTQTVNDHIVPDAAHIYAIRINNEWDYCASGPTPPGSACGTNTIPAATYVSILQQFINIIKNTLSAHSITNIKIEFDAPMNATQQAYCLGIVTSTSQATISIGRRNILVPTLTPLGRTV